MAATNSNKQQHDNTVKAPVLFPIVGDQVLIGVHERHRRQTDGSCHEATPKTASNQ